MKKIMSIIIIQMLFCISCRKAENNIPNEDNTTTISIVGKWDMTKTEVYLNGVLFDETPVDKGEIIMELLKDGRFIYWDDAKLGLFWSGWYEYDAKTKIVKWGETESDDVESGIIQATSKTLKWSYMPDDGGYMTVEYYDRN